MNAAHANPKNEDPKREAAILAIAKKYLHLETLEERRMDSLDFSEQAVWSLAAALQAAYDAGKAAR